MIKGHEFNRDDPFRAEHIRLRRKRISPCTVLALIVGTSAAGALLLAFVTYS